MRRIGLTVYWFSKDTVLALPIYHENNFLHHIAMQRAVECVSTLKLHAVRI